MALKHVMINDIISEHSARIKNIKKYYPFFVLTETTFAMYKGGKYEYLDMGYITLASLRFFINENNFHEKDVTYEEYEQFIIELLRRDFQLEENPEDERQLALYIFDKLKNDGKPFEFKFFDPESRTNKIARTKLIDSRIENGQVLYTITSDGIEFYLDTKEIKDESKINVSQLLLEKMITSNNFKGGIDVVRRINSQVLQLKAQKEQVLKLLSVDIFEGSKAYEQYMQVSAKWFNEEQKLFAKNKSLVEKAIERAASEQSAQDKPTLRSKALEEVSMLETELKKTIYNHSKLIAETMELTQLSDKIINRAKLRKLRPVFDYHACLTQLMQNDKPADMGVILRPFMDLRLEKSFSMRSIDNMLTLKSDDKSSGEKVEKNVLDLDFKYEDEKLDEHIGQNFAKLFYELLDQVKKWNRVTLKELNGIYEIKFGKEIYGNRDYYSFLVHLAGKNHYNLEEMLIKQNTLLEEMVVCHLTDEQKERLKDIAFDIKFNYDSEINVDMSDVRIGSEKDVFDDFVTTDMIFERSVR